MAGTSLVGPTRITSWVGWTFQATAPSPQGSYRFKRWSDGVLTATRTITTPSAFTTYRARFVT